ncbi:alcohol dehydrogenase catalytic domain-containing protein [Pseudomonas sp. B26140]|uniref:alcohol dehydrogenase catalytic domain-containing protein n=1 Tax=Pseudomonas sp. B26140 TaxID=3235112 RepID=UPI0037834991
MKAAVWRAGEEPAISIEEASLLPLRSRDVVVRVEASNVSISDHLLLAFDPIQVGWPAPQVLGHAAAGTVEKIGSDVRRVKIGDRVIVTSTPNCGECYFCLNGRPDQCATMVFVGPAHATLSDGTLIYPNASVGSFAELAVVPETQLTAVKTDLPSDQLSLLANPVGTGVGAALRTAPIKSGSTVAVVGCGPVGLAYIQGARIADAAQIIAIDPLPERRALAMRFGATHSIDPAQVDPVEAVLDLSEDAGGMLQGRGADYVFESAAESHAIEQAWAMARATGHVTFSSVCLDMMTAKITFPALPFALAGKTVHSCQYGSLDQRRDLPWLIGLAERGKLDLAGMIDRRYPLTQLLDAMRDAGTRSVIGPTLMPFA